MTLLANNADRRLLRADLDALDVVTRFSERLELLVQLHGRLDRSLRMELGRHELEQHVFHNVRAVWTLELERLALEKHVVKAPRFGRQHRVVPALAALHE